MRQRAQLCEDGGDHPVEASSPDREGALKSFHARADEVRATTALIAAQTCGLTRTGC